MQRAIAMGHEQQQESRLVDPLHPTATYTITVVLRSFNIDFEPVD